MALRPKLAVTRLKIKSNSITKLIGSAYGLSWHAAPVSSLMVISITYVNSTLKATAQHLLILHR